MEYNKNKNLLFGIRGTLFLSIFFVCFLFIFNINDVYAVTLDKSSYPLNGNNDTQIFTYCNDISSPIVIYNLTTGERNTVFYQNGCESSEAVAFPAIPGNYSILELTSMGICEEELLSYEECKLAPEFVNEFLFSLTPYVGGGNDNPVLDPELAPVGGHSITSYSPEVSIFSIFKGSLFSDDLVIDYKATDQNDNGTDRDRSASGLSSNPVSISYSDKIGEWYHNYIFPSERIEIVKDQPKEGKYKWSVKDLIPGILYRIIVEAIDASGLYGQAVSEYFSVDFTAPVFKVSVNPPVVRNGEVVITVDSSEDLSSIPVVKVIQNEGKAKEVIMKGEKSHYEGIYTVVSGFDGTAKVEVLGTDLAGNEGDTLISGGTFSVGVNPPRKPVIDNYKEKIVTIEEYIDVKGNVRPDTEAVLNVNGKEISKIKPDDKGNFSFTKIHLEKKNKGINYVNIYSKDPLGSISEGSLIEVKYNIPPTVKIVKPVVKDVLSNISPISVEGYDENSDIIFYTYQIISESNFNNKIDKWEVISENNPSSTFSWNTTEVEDGRYVLRVIASDGEVKVESSTVQVVVKNVLPYFRFENGRSTTTNLSKISIKGKALTSTNVTPRPDITSVAYSMDGGSTWTPVKIISDGGNYQKKFSAEFLNLKEGAYPILWRTKDSRGFIGKMVHSLIVDKTAPKAPIITSPKQSNEIVINDSNDENLNKSGIQISVKGKTEALSTVTLTHNSQVLTTKALPTGTFSFSDITFEKKGKYDLSIYTTDIAGNKSSPVTFSISYNNLPTISFVNPKPFGGLSSKANISWNIKDIDGDPISNIVVSYRNKDKDILFKNLVSSASAIGNYTWDTTNLVESNNYELKISASDPLGTTTSIESFSIDHTLPILTSFTFDKNDTEGLNKKVSFISKGDATDNLSGVEYVEYSVEGSDGKVSPWYKALITSGFLKNKSTFSIKHPVLAEDGEYKVYARAIDRASNISVPSLLTLSVDKVAPRIGSFFFEKNGVNLNPDDNGDLSIYRNSIFNFNISLEEDTKSAVLKIGDKIFPLTKDNKSQLWIADVSVWKESTEAMMITAIDFTGNTLNNKVIGNISISSRGTVSLSDHNGLVVGAKIKILKLNKETNQYNDFIALDSKNTEIVSNQDGEYDLVLPAGNYRFIISGTDISTLKYNLNLDRSSIVNLDFVVSKVSGIMKFINNLLGIFK